MRVSSDPSSCLRSPFATALRSEVQPTLGAQWLRPLTTDGQPCGEQLTQKPRAETLRTHATCRVSDGLERVPQILSYLTRSPDDVAAAARRLRPRFSPPGV